MSPETIRLLLSLLDQVVLKGSEPNIEEAAASIANARRELEGLLVQAPPSDN